MKQNNAILEDVALLARKQELDIPESIVIQMMPKPKLSQKVTEISKIQKENKRRNEATKLEIKQIEENIVFDSHHRRSAFVNKEPSYADRLRAIAEAQSEYSPEVLRSMLANARHGKVVVPAATYSDRKVLPLILGKQMSTK